MAKTKRLTVGFDPEVWNELVLACQWAGFRSINRFIEAKCGQVLHEYRTHGRPATDIKHLTAKMKLEAHPNQSESQKTESEVHNSD